MAYPPANYLHDNKSLTQDEMATNVTNLISSNPSKKKIIKRIYNNSEVLQEVVDFTKPLRGDQLA